MEKAFVYTFKTPKNYYIYDFNTNAIIKVKEKIYNILNKNENVLTDEVNEYTSELQAEGYLRPYHWEYIEHPATKFLRHYLNSSIESLTLQVTQQCNLRCSYCPYSGTYYNREHNNRKMSFELARKIIDFYIYHAYDIPVLQIGFYGGEPLLEFDLIKKIVNYTNKQADGKRVKYRITTNATLLNNNIIRFLVENNVSLTISLDGPKEYHDRNRLNNADKGSFDTIIRNIKKLNDQYYEYSKTVSINCVIDPKDDLKYLDEFFKCHEFLKNYSIMFSKIAKEGIKDEKSYLADESYQQRYCYEMFRLLYSKIENNQEIEVSNIVISYFNQLKTTIFKRGIYNSIEKGSHPGGPCVVGCHKLFVDIYGTFYPCERVSEVSPDMKIGNINAGFYEDKVNKLLNVGKLTETSCKKCWAAKFCFICAQHADTGTGLSIDNKLKHCNDIRLEAEENLKDYCLICEGNGFSEEVLSLNNNVEGDI